MARKHIANINVREEESEINLTPMLDVVFIMLILFGRQVLMLQGPSRAKLR